MYHISQRIVARFSWLLFLSLTFSANAELTKIEIANAIKSAITTPSKSYSANIKMTTVINGITAVDSGTISYSHNGGSSHFEMASGVTLDTIIDLSGGNYFSSEILDNQNFTIISQSSTAVEISYTVSLSGQNQEIEAIYSTSNWLCTKTKSSAPEIGDIVTAISYTELDGMILVAEPLQLPERITK